MSSRDSRLSRGVPTGAERVQACRERRVLRKYANDITPGANLVVLTQASIVHNLVEGRRVMVQAIHFGILTVSDNCHFEIGWTDAAGGAGAFHPLTGHRHVYTGASVVGRLDHHDDLVPPVCIRYSDGARSITYRVHANDANCQIQCEWAGWWEQE